MERRNDTRRAWPWHKRAHYMLTLTDSNAQACDRIEHMRMLNSGPSRGKLSKIGVYGPGLNQKHSLSYRCSLAALFCARSSYEARTGSHSVAAESS